VIDVATLGQNERPQVLNDTDQIWYELFSVLIHSGGALGGHYFAMAKVCFFFSLFFF
jgi:ubiquitin C-terminal hydrolase